MGQDVYLSTHQTSSTFGFRYPPPWLVFSVSLHHPCPKLSLWHEFNYIPSVPMVDTLKSHGRSDWITSNLEKKPWKIPFCLLDHIRSHRKSHGKIPPEWIPTQPAFRRTSRPKVFAAVSTELRKMAQAPWQLSSWGVFVVLRGRQWIYIYYLYVIMQTFYTICNVILYTICIHIIFYIYNIYIINSIYVNNTWGISLDQRSLWFKYDLITKKFDPTQTPELSIQHYPTRYSDQWNQRYLTK